MRLEAQLNLVKVNVLIFQMEIKKIFAAYAPEKAVNKHQHSVYIVDNLILCGIKSINITNNSWGNSEQGKC